MVVPENLKINAHVFCYSPDLFAASEKLAGYLDCKISKVYVGEPYDPQSKTANIAWLVGHGSKTDSKVGNSDGSFGYTIGSICGWLKNYPYTNLIDTCCDPNKRKRYQTFGDNYYCTNDNQCVEVITSYLSFDSWWDVSNMHQNIHQLQEK